MKSKTLALIALTLCSYLPAYTQELPREPKNEFQQLAVIATKYGNNPEGIPALHYAILQQDEPAVDLLLKYGASPFTQDYRHKNSLYYAIKAGNLDFVKKFITIGIDPNGFKGFVKDLGYEHNFPLQTAILDNQNEIAKYLINYGVQLQFEPKDDDDIDYLIDCAKVGNLEIYNLLLGRGVECKHQSDFLYWLASVVDRKHKQQKIEMFRNLLDRGIFGPNDIAGDRPLLHYVILESADNFDIQRDMIQLLVQYGADINHKDRNGSTPLRYAHGSRMIEFLKSLGAK